LLSQQSSSWTEIAGEHGIELQIVQSPVAGKNIVDVALVVEAMDVARDATVRTVCLVSSDADFIYLAHRLRAQGKLVWGFGMPHTPMALQAACCRFTDLSLIAPALKGRTPKALT